LLLVKIEKKLPNRPKNTFNNHVLLAALYGINNKNTSKTILIAMRITIGLA